MQNLVKHVDVLTQGLKSGISGLMNLTSQATESASGVNFVNFNQDCTSLAVGARNGYRLFSLNAVDQIEQIYENDSEDICIVERLFSSSLVAVVSLSSPRKLKVCHFKKGTEICNYSYSNTILAVKLNRARLVVCLEESLYIHNIRDMGVLHTIRDTPPNPLGLCTLSVDAENCFLAYPGSNTMGEVQIFDAGNLHAKTMIAAHDSPLAALSFSQTGGRIATASQKGTVIRVFNVADGTRLHEFRRGVKRCVSICSLAFSHDATFLCCSSNTETVHVFKLEEPKELPKQAADDTQGGWMGYFSKAVSASANYLPTQVTDVFNQGRAFASVRLPFQNRRNVCAVTMIQKQMRLLVASEDGYLYVYSLDMNEGGDCTLLKQHRLDGEPDLLPDSNARVPASPAPAQPCGSISSYAGILKGHSPDSMSGTDSEKFHEMAAATESPPKGGFRFDDDSEFPPVTQKTE
ncbi:WD repeat domain phosphoinositide-interacting protein 2 isoform X3 [Thrips palmi]|uniref:WD repeat domain phosphoinositide-interacting protein 2 isoform X3 n=1 Tax=Thrips palmi TaxID=161013 RepID=A0A6P8Z686_THRPL|nr:WD repeat domain phosphoinositide-interacting protein 2 isoform X3 [Thrips palmi]